MATMQPTSSRAVRRDSSPSTAARASKPGNAQPRPAAVRQGAGASSPTLAARSCRWWNKASDYVCAAFETSIAQSRRLIRIVVDGPPIGKGRPRFIRATGRAYTPTKTVNYEAILAAAGGSAMGRSPPLEGPLIIRVTAFMPIAASWTKRRLPPRSRANSDQVNPTPTT